MDTHPVPKPWRRVQDALTPLSDAERAGLAGLIAEHGVLHPILVLPDGRIIDGHNRWELSGESAPFAVLDIDDEAAFLLAVAINVERRQLNDAQAADFRRMMKEQPEAAKRAMMAMLEQGQTQESVAKATGYHRSRVSQIAGEMDTIVNVNNGVQVGVDGRSKAGHAKRRKIPVGDYPIIRRRADSGESFTKIASDYGVVKSAIQTFLQRNDPAREIHPDRRRRFTAEQEDDIERRYRVNGNAASSLAEAYGCSQHTIHNAINRARSRWPSGKPPQLIEAEPDAPSNVVEFPGKPDERRKKPADAPAKMYAPEVMLGEAMRWLSQAQNLNRDQLRGMRNRYGDAFVTALADTSEGELLERGLVEMVGDFASLIDDVKRARCPQEQRHHGRSTS
jgi:transposase-like protein